MASFPECAEAWLLVGAAAYQLGDAAGCVAACDRAIMLDPNLAEAYGNMGIALQATGRIDLAIVYYQVWVCVCMCKGVHLCMYVCKCKCECMHASMCVSMCKCVCVIA